MKKNLLFIGLTVCGVLAMNADRSKYITKILDFCPAPGQHVNVYPAYAEGDTKETMLGKVSEQLAGQGYDSDGLISLGAYGGYVVFGFDHPIVNVDGEYDFMVYGNAAIDQYTGQTEIEYCSSEAGIVMVSEDTNGNGIADDEWYELAGSDYSLDSTKKGVKITYYKPEADRALNADPDPDDSSINDRTYVKYVLNDGGTETTGYVKRNTFHAQSYWPSWVSDETVQYTGTMLASNVVNLGTSSNPHFTARAREWGYVDDQPNDVCNGFDISWAVDAEGNKVNLKKIDFVKVYTGVNDYAGWLGEISTEVRGAEDLHPEATVAGTDYSNGVFILNEGSVGFINYRDGNGKMHYRVIEQENDNKVQLGVTGQYGTIYGDKLYVCSKQSKDGTKTSGRLMVFDASTLKLEKSLATLANGSDPRAVLATDDYVYVSTSKGILVYDKDLNECKATLSDSQCGLMLEVGGKVFAMKYGKAVLVIDPATLTITNTIEGSYYAMVMGHDGNLWISTKDTNLLKLNPYTLAHELKTIDYKVPNTSYAWTADAFFANYNENKLYWKYDAGWGSSRQMYCYDIDAGTTTTIIDASEGNYEFYGAGFRMGPVDNKIYAAMNQASWGAGCAYREYSATGELLVDEELDSEVVIGDETLSLQYAFPALIIFPDRYAPVIHTDIVNQEICTEGVVEYPLTQLVTDADNADALIQVTAQATGGISAEVKDGKLVVKGTSMGEGQLTINANSNGKKVSATIDFTTTGIHGAVADDANVGVYVADRSVIVETPADATVAVCGIDGRVIYTENVAAGTTVLAAEVPASGVYVVKVGNVARKIAVK